MEHVGRFIHTIGSNARDRELYLREFAKSLVDRAYTWYTTLRPRSIKTWDKMMERFCEKYYFGEDKVTFQSLQMIRQRPGEDPVLFIKRFKDVSLDCNGDHKEKELVETCIYPTCSLITGSTSKIYASPNLLTCYKELKGQRKL